MWSPSVNFLRPPACNVGRRRTRPCLPSTGHQWTDLTCQPGAPHNALCRFRCFAVSATANRDRGSHKKPVYELRCRARGPTTTMCVPAVFALGGRHLSHRKWIEFAAYLPLFGLYPGECKGRGRRCMGGGLHQSACGVVVCYAVQHAMPCGVWRACTLQGGMGRTSTTSCDRGPSDVAGTYLVTGPILFCPRHRGGACRIPAVACCVRHGSGGGHGAHVLHPRG